MIKKREGLIKSSSFRLPRLTKLLRGQKKAFALIEVVMAMLILSLSIFVLVKYQADSYYAISDNGQYLIRYSLIKKQLYRALGAPQTLDKKPLKKTLDDPDCLVRFMKEPISRKSELAPYRKFLARIIGSGEWKEGTQDREIPFVGFVVSQPPEEGI